MHYFPFPFFLLFCVSTLLFGRPIHAQPPLNQTLNFNCPPPGDVDPSAEFKDNLNLLLPRLANPSRIGFSTQETVGEGDSVVYGLATCFPEFNISECLGCLQNASGEIMSRCPNRMEASIVYQVCILRYSHSNFVGVPDPKAPRYNMNNSKLVPFDLSRPEYPYMLGELVGKLTLLASSSGGFPGYANLTSVVDSDNNLFGVAMCTPDLKPTDCTSCLDASVAFLLGCCYPNVGARIYSLSCYLRFENAQDNNFFTPLPPPPPPPSPPPPPPPPSPSNDQGSWKIWVIALLGVIAVLSLSIAIWQINKAKTDVVFNSETLKRATNNFRPDNLLGSGGFGSVYKGRLDNGRPVAVKRLTSVTLEGRKQLINEVVLMELRHKNIVRVLGFSLKGSLLCYEYLPNSSLDKFIFGPSDRRSQLDWKLRYRIIKGVSRGLSYIHEDFPGKIVHRDLKASNILLDGDMNPKISDFGLAYLLPLDKTHVEVSRLAGTFGYMAPEYRQYFKYSAKSDVYSFGIIILEIISGTRINANDTNLIQDAWQHWSQGTIEELKDPTLENKYIEELTRCVNIALLCVQADPEDRPKMENVNEWLTQTSVQVPVPAGCSLFT